MADLSSLVPLADPASAYPALMLAVLLSAAGLPLPVSALLVAVGVASAGVSVPLLILLCALCTVAAVAGDSLDYLLGRVGAPAFVARFVPSLVRFGARLGLRWPPTRGLSREQWLTRASGERRRGAVLALFTSRFIPPLMPLATPISLALGASRFAFLPFLLWDLLGEAVFVGGTVAVGRAMSGPLAVLGSSPLLLWSALTLLSLLTLAPAVFTLARSRRRDARRAKNPGRANSADRTREELLSA